VNFHEQSVNAGCDTRSRQMRNIFRLTAGPLTLSAGELQTMRYIEHHWTAETLHDGKTSEIHHEIVVAKGSTTFGEQYTITAGLTDFLNDILHFPWGEELPFLHVHDLTGLRSCEEQVRLTREERWDLKDVENLPGRLAL
jgi:hypothetical protein